MQKVGFFTPIVSRTHWASQVVDNLFYLGGDVADHLPCECEEDTYGVKLSTPEYSRLHQVVNITCYAAAILCSLRQLTSGKSFNILPHIPSIALITLFLAKVYVRATSTYHICYQKPAVNFPEPIQKLFSEVMCPLDKYPVLENFKSYFPTVSDMTHPIMIGNAGNRPFISIKVYNSNDKSYSNILLHASSTNTPNGWVQTLTVRAPNLFPSSITYADGTLAENSKDAWELFKSLIKYESCDFGFNGNKLYLSKK